MEEVAGDDDEAYLAMLEQRRSAIAASQRGDGIAAEMDEWTDDEEVDSALDSRDPFALLVNAMNSLQAQHPEQFAVRLSSRVSCVCCCIADIIISTGAASSVSLD